MEIARKEGKGRSKKLDDIEDGGLFVCQEQGHTGVYIKGWGYLLPPDQCLCMDLRDGELLVREKDIDVIPVDSHTLEVEYTRR